MNLYQIDAAILELVDPETGEIENWEAFEQLQMEREAKIENAACYLKNTMAEIEAFKVEEANLAKRRSVLENRGKRLKAFLEGATGGEKFETPRCLIKWTKTTKCEIEDMAEAVQWLEMHGHTEAVKYTAPTCNLSEVKKLLKAEIPVPGAALIAGSSMSVK